MTSPANVLILSGTDSYTIDMLVDEHCPRSINRSTLDFADGATITDAQTALGSMSLFGGSRDVVIRNADQLADPALTALIAALDGTSARAAVVAKHRSRAANQLNKKFAGTVVTAPKAAELPGAVTRIASRYHVNLSRRAATMIAERSAGDLWRCDSFFRALQAAEITDIRDETAANLFCDTSAGPTPWQAIDELDAGRVDQAFTLATQVDPFAFCAWTSGQLEQAARCAEQNAHTSRAAANVLSCPEWVARRPARWSKIRSLHPLRLTALQAEIDLRSNVRPASETVRQLLVELCAALRT